MSSAPWPILIHHLLMSGKVIGVMDAAKLTLAGCRPGNYALCARPHLTMPMQIRGNTGDYHAFYTVFVRRDYAFPVHDEAPRFIVDAGANVGCSALYFAGRFPGAEIIAIEPDPANFALLEKNTAGHPRISLRQAALWPRNDARLRISGDNSLSMHCEESSEPAQGALPALTVDDILAMAEHDEIDILKLDIEGAEEALFASNTDWLRRVRRLWIEIHDGCWKTVFDALHGYEYAVTVLGENLEINLRPPR